MLSFKKLETFFERLPAWGKYLFAVVLTALVFLLRMGVGHTINDPPALVIFIIPIIASSYFVGIGPGIVSTVTSGFLAQYLFILPFYSLKISRGLDIAQLLIFIVVGFVVNYTIYRMDQTQKKLTNEIFEKNRIDAHRKDVDRTIRHDIKSPLIGLYNIANISTDNTVYEKFRETIPLLAHSILHLIKMMDSFEKISQIEKGEYTPEKSFFDIEGILNAIELNLNPLIKAKRLRMVKTGMLDSTAQQGAARFFGETFLVENMLTNLVKNALEASPEDCDVTVSFCVEPNDQRIDIHNLGAIPETMRECLFKKYATAGKLHGTGLGAYSAQLIARAHGGRVEFTTSEDKGTTVSVILPSPKP